jgi:hypothetical protein
MRSVICVLPMCMFECTETTTRSSRAKQSSGIQFSVGENVNLEPAQYADPRYCSSRPPELAPLPFQVRRLESAGDGHRFAVIGYRT